MEVTITPKLQRFAKTRFKKDWETNTFGNNDLKFDDPALKGFIEQISENVAEKNLVLNDGNFKQNNRGTVIEVGKNVVEFQKHQLSVQEHTDDVTSGNFFGCVVVDLHQKVESTFVSGFPLFNYYDETGKKRSFEMGVGDMIIFNPKKKHSVVWFGMDYTVALFDVRKMK